MIDWGIISTAVATVIASLATGLGTWATMRKGEKDEIEVAEDAFIRRLLDETADLRARMDRMQETIDTLMEERRILKNQVTDLEIKVRQQDATIKHLTGTQ